MSLTFEEVKDKLKEIDEITLLEKLEIYSDDIVERFEDKIEERLEQLEEEFSINNEEENESD